MEVLSTKNLSEDHYEQISVLHQKSLALTLNSQIGQAHIYDVYKLLSNIPYCEIFALSIDGQVVCSISFTFRVNILKGLLRKKFLKRYLKFAILHPAMFRSFYLADNLVSTESKKFSESIYLLTLFTHPDFRDKGYGALLVNKMLEVASKDFRGVLVDVGFQASDAIGFYRGLGFKLVAENEQCSVLFLDLEI